MNCLAFFDISFNHMEKCTLFGLAFLYQGINFLLEHGQLLCHCGIQRQYGTCTIGARTYCAEFKSITCKSKRRSTVSIGIVQQDLGDIAHTQLHLLLGIDNDTLIHICILNLSQRFGELRT